MGDHDGCEWSVKFWMGFGYRPQALAFRVIVLSWQIIRNVAIHLWYGETRRSTSMKCRIVLDVSFTRDIASIASQRGSYGFLSTANLHFCYQKSPRYWLTKLSLHRTAATSRAARDRGEALATKDEKTGDSGRTKSKERSGHGLTTEARRIRVDAAISRRSRSIY